MIKINFRPYRDTDHEACTNVFDANCPEFFVPNERQDYEEFLNQVPENYVVCEVNENVLGAFGLYDSNENTKTLNWILLDPKTRGIGLGTMIMKRVIQLSRKSQTKTVRIAASHKSAPFFAKFGASTTTSTKNGWGPDMHRVDMELSL